MDPKVVDLVLYLTAMDPNSSPINKRSEKDELNTQILSSTDHHLLVTVQSTSCLKSRLTSPLMLSPELQKLKRPSKHSPVGKPQDQMPFQQKSLKKADQNSPRNSLKFLYPSGTRDVSSGTLRMPPSFTCLRTKVTGTAVTTIEVSPSCQ